MQKAIDRMDDMDGDAELEPCEAQDDIGSNVLPFGKIGFVEISGAWDDDPAGGDVCDELHDASEYYPLLPVYGHDQSHGPLNEIEAERDYQRRLEEGYRHDLT